jgi:hypothetical protein
MLPERHTWPKETLISHYCLRNSLHVAVQFYFGPGALAPLLFKATSQSW